jgi:hypothetical protein
MVLLVIRVESYQSPKQLCSSTLLGYPRKPKLRMDSTWCCKGQVGGKEGSPPRCGNVKFNGLGIKPTIVDINRISSAIDFLQLGVWNTLGAFVAAKPMAHSSAKVSSQNHVLTYKASLR